MYSAKELVPFLTMVKEKVPMADIWIYSGFTFEEITCDPDMRALLEQCDVLVDGPFVLEKRDITLPYKGSSNQRIIDIKQSLLRNKIIQIDV